MYTYLYTHTYFALSRRVTQNSRLKGGTLAYMAPETLAISQYISQLISHDSTLYYSITHY